MRFYYWILLIVVFVNALLLFSSTGKLAESYSYIFKNPSSALIIIAISSFCILVIVLAFIFASKARY